MGDRASDRGSEPGLAAGERPGVRDAAASAASVVAAASDARGSAIAAVVQGVMLEREDDGEKKCNLEAAMCTCLRRYEEVRSCSAVCARHHAVPSRTTERQCESRNN